MKTLKHLLIHLAEASDYKDIIEGIREACEEYLKEESEESKQKLSLGCQAFIMKFMMTQESKSAEELIDDVEKFQKVNKLFDFEKN